MADVSVLANYDSSDPKRYPMGIYMPVQSASPVRFADEGGIHVALGIDKMFEYEREYEEKITIPAGLIRMSNGTRVRGYLDKRYVLGPEGAHVNIAGISGLATKTSYAMFLIQSILQTVGARDIAVVLLNVKQNDLLVIDKPRRNPKPEDIELWEFLGLRPQPFENVRYLLPWGKETQTTGLPNAFGEPPDQFQTYSQRRDQLSGEFLWVALGLWERPRRAPTDTWVCREHFPESVPGARMPEMREGERRWR